VIKEVIIGEQKNGAFGENADWWYLIIEDNGMKFVRHEWSHLDPAEGGVNEGSKKIAVDDFLAGDASSGLKLAVREELKRL
jgi:hypothetical protein